MNVASVHGAITDAGGHRRSRRIIGRRSWASAGVARRRVAGIHSDGFAELSARYESSCDVFVVAVAFAVTANLAAALDF